MKCYLVLALCYCSLTELFLNEAKCALGSVGSRKERLSSSKVHTAGFSSTEEDGRGDIVQEERMGNGKRQPAADPHSCTGVAGLSEQFDTAQECL